MHSFVRPDKIMNALCWLKQNNSHYSTINICSDWVTIWEREEPELWDALTNSKENEKIFQILATTKNWKKTSPHLVLIITLPLILQMKN